MNVIGTIILPTICLLAFFIMIVYYIISNKKLKNNGNVEVKAMGKETKEMPAAKIVTLLATVFLLAIGGLLFGGLVEFEGLFVSQKYGMSALIDEIEWLSEDFGGYFKGLWESIELGIKAIDKGNGITDLCMGVLTNIFPLVAIFCFFMVALRMAFFWLPLLSVKAIGWSRVAVRMGKRLKKIVAWTVGFVVYCFAVYGNMVDFTTLGEVMLYAIAAYAILRVVIDGVGKGSGIVNLVFTTISAAAIAVFAVIVLKHFLVLSGSLWASVFACVETAATSMQGEEKNTDWMIYGILMAVYYLAVFIALQRVAKATEKQITMNRGGVRKSLVWLLIWTVAAAALNFFANKQIYEKLSLSDFLDMKANKFVVKSLIYGAIGLGLAIVTPILNCIGRSKSKEHHDKEYEE